MICAEGVLLVLLLLSFFFFFNLGLVRADLHQSETSVPAVADAHMQGQHVLVIVV